MMRFEIDPVEYVDQRTLDDIADKQAVNDYMANFQQMGQVSIFINDGLRALVRDLVAKLPEFERKIIRMRFWGNCSISEIARVVDLSELHTKEILAKTLEILKEKIIRAEKGVQGKIAVKKGSYYV